MGSVTAKAHADEELAIGLWKVHFSMFIPSFTLHEKYEMPIESWTWRFPYSQYIQHRKLSRNQMAMLIRLVTTGIAGWLRLSIPVVTSQSSAKHFSCFVKLKLSLKFPEASTPPSWPPEGVNPMSITWSSQMADTEKTLICCNKKYLTMAKNISSKVFAECGLSQGGGF